MTTDSPIDGISKAENDLRLSCWELANEMRRLENNKQMEDSAKLKQYEQKRADLEEKLADIENRELPEDHRNND